MKKLRTTLRPMHIVLMFVLCVLGTSAQSLHLSAPGEVYQGKTFTVTYKFVNAPVAMGRANAPKIANCTLLYGPAQTTLNSYSSTSGSISAVEYTYTYRAEKAGRTRIPAANFTYNGVNLNAKEKTLNVLPDNKASEPSQSNANQGSQHSPQQAATNPFSANDFMVRVTFSKTNVYKGQGVIADIKLYTRHDVISFVPTVMPVYEGFLAEELQVPNAIGQETINGQQYTSVILKRTLLYPQESGKLTVNAGRYEVTLRAIEWVSYGYFSTPQEVTKKIVTESREASLNVKPLPDGAPASFGGAVGKFTLTAGMQTQQLRTNEPATYKVTISGAGNLTHLSAPVIKFPESFDTGYTPQTKTDAEFNGATMSGDFTAEYSMVPGVVGEQDMEAWNWSYFDPEDGRYHTINEPAQTFNVLKGVAGATPAAQTNATTITDILYNHPTDGKELTRNHVPLVHKPIYWLAYLLVTVVFLAGVLMMRKRATSNSAQESTRLRKAKNKAVRRLAKARAAITAGAVSKVYDELAIALWGFVREKFKLQGSELTRSNLEQIMSENNVDATLISECINVLDKCEMARFMPDESGVSAAAVYEESYRLILALSSLKLNETVKNQRDVSKNSYYEQ